MLASFLSALPLLAVFLLAEFVFLFSVATEFNGLFRLLILSIFTRAKVGTANFISPVLLGWGISIVCLLDKFWLILKLVCDFEF